MQALVSPGVRVTECLIVSDPSHFAIGPGLAVGCSIVAHLLIQATRIGSMQYHPGKIEILTEAVRDICLRSNQHTWTQKTKLFYAFARCWLLRTYRWVEEIWFGGGAGDMEVWSTNTRGQSIVHLSQPFWWPWLQHFLDTCLGWNIGNSWFTLVLHWNRLSL